MMFVRKSTYDAVVRDLSAASVETGYLSHQLRGERLRLVAKDTTIARLSSELNAALDRAATLKADLAAANATIANTPKPVRERNGRFTKVTSA